MKKVWLFLILAAVVVAWSWSLKQASVPVPEHAEIPEAASPAANAVTSAPPTAPTKATNGSPTPEEAAAIKVPVDPMDECWAKLAKESQSEPEFFASASAKMEPTVGKWFFDTKEEKTDPPHENHLPGKFMLALGKAALLEGKTLPKDDAMALALLREVMVEDPKNSAPIIYAVLIERRLGNRKGARELLRKLRDTDRFDSYLDEINNAILAQVSEPQDYIPAIGILSRTPVPIVGKDLRKILERSKQGTKIAQQMVASGTDPRRRELELRNKAVEYSVGYQILQANGLDRGVPPLSEIYDADSANNHELTIKGAVGAGCELDSLRPAVERLQSNLREN